MEQFDLRWKFSAEMTSSLDVRPAEVWYARRRRIVEREWREWHEKVERTHPVL
jgi:hypothetical protein